VVETPSIDEIQPIDKSADYADYPVGADAEAPYGRKKDGTPAKKRGRQAGYTLGPRTAGVRGKGSLKTQIGGLLTLVNMPLMMIPPLQRDVLAFDEIDALAEAIDQQCQVSPQFRKYVENALKVGGGTSLVGVIAIIVGRRAIRHDILPVPDEQKEQLDAAAGQLLNVMRSKGAVPAPVFTE
jgi:hypothetical protein